MNIDKLRLINNINGDKVFIDFNGLSFCVV